MRKKQILIYITILLLYLPQAVLATLVSFDLDETLVQSNHLDKKALIKAKELGYSIQTSKKGQDYIVRPGAIELLNYAQAHGFDLMIFTHNYRDYAIDILESSGLSKYFIDVKTHEDVIKPYNRDFKLYPNHRNITYKQKSFFEAYTVELFNGFLVNGISRIQGNRNIQVFLPCTNCAKYPPLYGARVHIDNSLTHVDSPKDFVGIKVDNFYADKLEPLTRDGEYIWVAKIKEDLIYLKRSGWARLYRHKYNKDPDTSSVALAK